MRRSFAVFLGVTWIACSCLFVLALTGKLNWVIQ